MPHTTPTTTNKCPCKNTTPATLGSACLRFAYRISMFSRRILGHPIAMVPMASNPREYCMEDTNMKRLLILLSLCAAMLGVSAPSYAYTRCNYYHECVRYVPVYRPVVYERRVIYERPYWQHHHHWHRHWHHGYYGGPAVIIRP